MARVIWHDSIPRNTLPDRGIEIGVALRKEHDDAKSPQETCLAVLDNWGVGKAHLNNGVLIYMATESRKFQVCTAEGTRGAPNNVSNALCEQIFEDVKPSLRSSRWAGATETAIAKLRRGTSGDTGISLVDVGRV